MPRPCRARHPKPVADGCTFCRLYQERPDYRAHYDESPPAAAPAGRFRRSLPCRHLGPPTGETRDCATCAAKKDVPLLGCAIHDRCTRDERLLYREGGYTVEVPWCRTCPDYAPAPHEEGRGRAAEGDPPCGLVVGSYGDPGIVELQVRLARHLCGEHVPVLVADDTPEGPLLDRLESLETQYPGVTVWPNPERRGHYAGDLSAFWKALQWGHSLGLAAVAKVSKRLLLTATRWLQEGARELLASGLATASRRCIDRGHGPDIPINLWVRSEAVLLDVAKWLPHHHLFDRHELGNATELYLWDLIVKHFGGRMHPWSLLTEERNRPCPGTVWHCTHGPEAYHEWAAKFGVTLGPEFDTGPAQNRPDWKRG